MKIISQVVHHFASPKRVQVRILAVLALLCEGPTFLPAQRASAPPPPAQAEATRPQGDEEKAPDKASKGESETHQSGRNSNLITPATAVRPRSTGLERILDDPAGRALSPAARPGAFPSRAPRPAATPVARSPVEEEVIEPPVKDAGTPQAAPQGSGTAQVPQGAEEMKEVNADQQGKRDEYPASPPNEVPDPGPPEPAAHSVTPPIQPPPQRAPQGSVLESYSIGAGDILQISVWKEPDVSVDGVAVRSDGKISLPLIKEVHVVGLKPAELELVLKQKFSQFINDPEVTVIVTEINSEKVYVIGGVANQGSVPLQAPMTVLQVLAEVGGLTEFAKRKKIYVLREVAGGKQVQLPFDYEAVLKGRRPEQNIAVKPGDTIVVPE